MGRWNYAEPQNSFGLNELLDPMEKTVTSIEREEPWRAIQSAAEIPAGVGALLRFEVLFAER